MTCNTSAVGGLLLQRFAGFSDQPRIFHRNDRLRGKVLKQCNFFFCERADLLPGGDDLTQQRAVFTERDRQERSDASEFDRSSHPGVIELRQIGVVYEAVIK
jgi:hypothetical protein